MEWLGEEKKRTRRGSECMPLYLSVLGRVKEVRHDSIDFRVRRVGALGYRRVGYWKLVPRTCILCLGEYA